MLRRVASAVLSPGVSLRPRIGLVAAAPARLLNVHEYISHDIMRKNNVSVVRGAVASSPEEAEKIAIQLSSDGVQDFVVKAQVLAGGRGKGHFSNGFQGGVHSCTSPTEARELARQMIGHRLITKQSGAEGKPVSKVYICERLYLRREAYFAILLDRSFGGPVIVASSKGGVDIEQVAVEHPDKIIKIPIDINTGITDAQAEQASAGMGFTGNAFLQTKEIVKNLYSLFTKTDATLIEVNPLGETPDGKVRCVDAKLNFDDNAEFRQEDVFEQRDRTQEDPREVAASAYDLNYIGLDGNIGCIVNGAGLAMATLDIIKIKGGNPANFLDLGGGANESQVTKAFEILNNDPKVVAILINIFGGIMKCDIIALGILRAVSEIGIKKPLVVRLAGTNVEAANKLLNDSGLRVLTGKDLEDAAEKAVRVAEIVRMAKDAQLDVKFELPL